MAIFHPLFDIMVSSSSHVIRSIEDNDDNTSKEEEHGRDDNTSEEEEHIIVFNDEDIQEGISECKRNLVGKIVTEKPIHKSSLIVM